MDTDSSQETADGIRELEDLLYGLATTLLSKGVLDEEGAAEIIRSLGRKVWNEDGTYHWKRKSESDDWWLYGG